MARLRNYLLPALVIGVLAMWAGTIDSARLFDTWGLMSDVESDTNNTITATSLAAPILIGLGVHELSVVPSAVPQLKALIATLTIGACREIAQAALAERSADAVRALVTRALSRARALATGG